MKKYLLLLFFSFSLIAKAQDKLVFEYDDAGNQKTRYLCIGCPSTTGKKANSKEIAALKEEDFEKFYPEDVISYYPNPVKEELYLKWELVAEKAVNAIFLYGINGQVVQTYNNLDKANNLNIPFYNYPTGTYLVVLLYNDGEQKTIKIVK